MTDRQIAKFSMYTVVDAVLDANAAAVGTIAALGTAHTSLKAKIAALSSTSEQQQTITTGITPDKNNTRAMLRNSTFINAGLLYAYAVSINDIVLQSLSKITQSEVNRLKDDELAERAQTIHDNALPHIASLPPFGITPALLTLFQALIDIYEAKAPAPRARQSQQVALTEQVKTLITETDSLLKNTADKLMLNFKAGSVEFYNTYVSAREVIDAASIPTQVAGIIQRISTDIPLINVGISVAGQAYSASTGLNGSYSLKIPVPGLYTLNFSAASYQPKSIPNVLLALGQTTTLNVELEPIGE